MSTDELEANPTERAATVGTVGALIASLPLIGPALVVGCASCIGVGAATGLAATSALPPTWWLAGLAVTATGTVIADRRAAHRCQRAPAPARTLTVLVAVAVAAWLATRFVIVPGIGWLAGGSTPPSDGPILP